MRVKKLSTYQEYKTKRFEKFQSLLFQQSGFSIMSALFIVVILALIGSYIVSLASLTSSSGNLIVQGTKAYFAAKSGLEWGIYKVAPSAGSGSSGPPYNCPTSPTTLTFSEGGLKGFQAIVSCSQVPFTEGNVNYNIFQINSVGQYGTAGPDFALRQLYVTVIQPGV